MSGITKAALFTLAMPLLAAPAFAADQPAGGLALKRVLLSTGGVGYFEYEAQVSGDAALTLEVRRDQVDDVLKSIVVYDDKGGIGTVDLPGQEPLETAFRELPFSPDDLNSPTALLNAMKGAEVRVAGARELSGRLLSVTEETTQLPNGGGIVLRHRVSLMTAEGLRQLVLEETDSLRFADPRVQAQLDKALTAVAESAGKERRRLTIRTTAPKDGAAADRTVRVAYVVAAPLWKATYRLTLPEAGAKTGDLQGWAVLENVSGDDWKDVELSVASGNPVTFRQALYSAYFVNRPEVPVEVLGRVLPKPDEGAVAADRMAKAEVPEPRARAGAAPPVAAMAAPPAPMAAAPMTGGPMPAPAPFGRPMPQSVAEAIPAESAEATAQVLFRYPQPVTLANGGTLMMPIVARAVPAERLDLYQPGTQPRHPLAALRLKNDGNGDLSLAGGLPPGVLTLYEKVGNASAYVGDARLATLPAGESRLLSFAVDQAVTVDRSEQPSRTLSRATLADGVLQLTVTERQTTTYSIAGAAREDRTVVVEHPRRPGWTLVDPANPAPEATEAAYRLPVTVPAGKTVTLAVALERPQVERVGLADLAPEQVLAYAASAELPANVREALGKVASLRMTVAEKERRVADIEREQADIAREQERLRQNLSTLPRDSDLFKRTIAKMGDQETRLDTLSRDLGTARKDADAARTTLRDQVRAMKF